MAVYIHLNACTNGKHIYMRYIALVYIFIYAFIFLYMHIYAYIGVFWLVFGLVLH